MFIPATVVPQTRLATIERHSVFEHSGRQFIQVLCLTRSFLSRNESSNADAPGFDGERRYCLAFPPGAIQHSTPQNVFADDESSVYDLKSSVACD